MRIGLAAKLCLLAAILVLGTTYAAGTLFYEGARVVVRERELADLRDEAALQARELIHELQNARADLLTLSGSDEVRAVAATLARGESPNAAERAALGKVFQRLLEHQSNYLTIAFIRNDSGGTEIARASAPRAGESNRGAADRRWLGEGDFEHGLRLSPQTVAFSEVRSAPRPAGERVLEQVVTLAVHPAEVKKDAAGVVQPLGVMLLRLDFGALVSRLNAYPRVLGFLVNASGQYLAHPIPADVSPASGSPAGTELDRAFAKLREQTLAKANDSRPPGGMQLERIHLPGLEFYLTSGRIARDPDAERLREALEALRHRHPGVRGEGAEQGDMLILRGFVEADLRAAMTDFQNEYGATVDWESPYRCADFAAYLLPVRLDPDRPHRAVTGDGRPGGGSAQWLGLGLALPHEAMDHAMQANYARTRWYSITLGGIAGAGAFVFALYLTRPLRQMIGVAQQVADGQDAEVDLPALRGRDEIGTLARALTKMMDQVRRRTRELRESEARIRTILNTAAEGIVTIDEHGRLESFNQAAERIFGYRADDVRGQHFTKLLQRGAPSDMPTLLGSVVLPSGSFGAESSMYNIRRVTGTTREVIGRRRDGAPFPVEMAVSEVVLGDRLVYTAILRDITDRKQAESQIRHMTEELEHRVQERTAELMQANQSLEYARDLALEANRAKDAFLATMSHELRTPLNAIIGYCDYWLREAEELDPDEMSDDLRKMHQSGKHLLTLINDILDLAKIQAGKVTLDPADFDVPPLLDELREWVEPLVRKNDNTLTLECPPDLGTMRADRTRVRQVLLNLLSNAAKFTKSGSIRLRADRRVTSGHDELVFEVIDTGVGMKPDDVRRLFRETFFQAETSGTRKHEGTGLGLVICKKLCLLMGGDIDVQSTVGAGTTFTVRLPAQPAPEAVGAASSMGPMGPMGPTGPTGDSAQAAVLVIDDDPSVRDLVCRVLGREGYQVHAAADGAAGLELARQIRPRAIVLDALMPGMDGWAVLSALKSDPTTGEIPVVMATMVDDKSRGFALGATDYIVKPIDWNKLAAVLRANKVEPSAGPVLIVDDDAAAREVTARHLRSAGFQVVEAADGREALTRLRVRRPGVVLLDLLMPGMDGFAFAEAMRREEMGRGVPVVVVTAADLTPADRERLARSVQQVIRKGDVTPEQLLEEVRERVRACVVG